MSGRCYLVRHGQSEWNLLEVTQGQTGWPRLTEDGRSQAALAATLIGADLGPGAGVDLIRHSDLVRATETAEILQRSLGGTLEPDVRLREQHLGALEGRPYAETWAAVEHHDWSDPTLPVAGGESVAQVRERVAAALADTPSGSVCVLVTHGDTIRAALATLRRPQGRPAPEPPDWVDVPNGAVLSLTGAEHRWLG